MRIDVITLFPGMFEGVFAESIPRIAREKGALEAHWHNLRDYTANRHGKVDDRPCGGGPGMVLACQPVMDAVAAVRALDGRPSRLVFLTPEGRRFDQSLARAWAAEDGDDRRARLIFVCGRYEGFDERLFELLEPERLSVGDFILSGGEIAAMVVIDALARLLPGVLGCGESAAAESFAEAGGGAGGLDHPQYTLPAVYAGLSVPEVLRGGDHARIAAWRAEAARRKTARWRPDLLGLV